ncbi:uncharacterized protein LOC122639080 [Telopea speciosissima]|uniref:uncharacterized protein LOC122639080 n=1 Tax=Telopea speciosissima TaxID=54955 RepID=UPI001CC47BF6|nr:uncharacterized protein LOC122639080 [Telopea speciosissima]
MDTATPPLGTPVRDIPFPPDASRSWASLLGGDNSRDESVSIPFIGPAIVNGEKVAFCPADDLDEEKARGDAALVAYVFGQRPSFSSMKRYALEKWAHVGAVEVYGLESGIFIFDFQDASLSRQILNEGPWTLGSRPLILRPWSSNVSLTKKEETLLPLWVRLYGLNLHFWGNRSLGCIASVIGKPICMDQRTAQRERLSFARLYVLVSATDGLPDLIPISLEDGSVLQQPIVYEWAPPHCSACKVFGHSTSSCPHTMATTGVLEAELPKIGQTSATD